MDNIANFDTSRFFSSFVEQIVGGQNYTCKTIRGNFQSQQPGMIVKQRKLFLGNLKKFSLENLKKFLLGNLKKISLGNLKYFVSLSFSVRNKWYV